MKNLLILAGFFLFLASSCTDSSTFNPDTEGKISGKYKTMLVVGDFMYAVNNSELATFDMTDKSNPVQIDKTDVGSEIENIYESEKVLFIGSRTNLHIYAIGSNGIPQQKSDTEYVAFSEDNTPCDPVVAQKDIAYVTLSSEYWSSNGPCATLSEVNELRAYDISNLSSPKLMKTIEMDSPRGLSVDGDYLFVSNAELGFEVFELDHKGSITSIDRYMGFDSYDLIAKDNKLLVVSPTEIKQFDYSDINNIVLYSTLQLK